MKKLLLIVFLTQIFNISFSQTILQPAGMKYDMAVLKATWQNIHPALYRFNTQQEIEKFFSKLDLQINKPITLRRFYILISQLNIKLHCGHSYVNYYNNKKIKNELYSK